jgi:hypothetical protein
MKLSQRTYIERMQTRYLGDKHRAYATPMAVKPQLTTAMSPVTEKDRQAMESIPYRELLGSLQYVTLTRPDVIQAISDVARFQQNPGMTHYEAALRILNYLVATKDHSIVWKRTEQSNDAPWKLRIHVDADWANDTLHRRSRSGFLIMANGNLLSFGSGLQPKTASSTAVAEYVALASAVKELLWIKQLLSGMGQRIELPVPIEEDNQACIHIATQPSSSKRTRAVDIRYHFIRDCHSDGIIKVRYCRSREQLADILTKTLPRVQFLRLRELLVSDTILEPD